MDQKKVRIADVTQKAAWFLTVSTKAPFLVQTTVKHFRVLQRRENSTLHYIKVHGVNMCRRKLSTCGCS